MNLFTPQISDRFDSFQIHDMVTHLKKKHRKTLKKKRKDEIKNNKKIRSPNLLHR